MNDARLSMSATAMHDALKDLLFVLEQEGDITVIAPAYRSALLEIVRRSLVTE